MTRDDARLAEMRHLSGAARAKRKPLQFTHCDNCGRGGILHDEAVWTEDGSSFCKGCFPGEVYGSAMAIVATVIAHTARAKAEAQDAAEIAGKPIDPDLPSLADFIGATAIFALLFAAGVVIREGLLIWGLL